MRIPKGAPSSGLLRWQQHFPKLRGFRRPTNGTLAVVGCVSVILTFMGIMFVQPIIYKDYYKEMQAIKRAQIGADREKLAQGMRPWSDPFKSAN